MKNKIKSVITASIVPFLLMQAANGSFLIGWNDFDENSISSEAPDVAIGFSGSVIKSLAANSLGAGGSPTGTYGSSAIPAAGGNVSNDGWLRVTSGNPIRFSMTNISTNSMALQQLFFDSTANTVGLQPTIQVSYSINGGAEAPVGTQLLPISTFSDQYVGYAMSLAALPTISMGSNLDLIFRTASAGFRLDNIAIGTSAIPEPGNLLALGLMVSGGLFVRLRKRIA